ncbi:UNVERIFIED_CONTAM: Pre-splicing factor CLF1 [Sesamum calycinum]|uniref:Pre-splicing factor CLF1 n=1 Tax=Sesamum calycinum TaxID=2727403 RepID=A0AAW2KDZ6_9LAMI
MVAQFEIRQLNIDQARRILGLAIGMAPKDKNDAGSCMKNTWSGHQRTVMPGPWSKFSELGRSLAKLNEPELFLNLQIGQPARDTPDLLWKVLNRTKHLRVWIGYAKFEASAMDEGLQESDLRESDYEQRENAFSEPE